MGYRRGSEVPNRLGRWAPSAGLRVIRERRSRCTFGVVTGLSVWSTERHLRCKFGVVMTMRVLLSLVDARSCSL
eukprot:2476738-Prymnesium_polylepis.2